MGTFPADIVAAARASQAKWQIPASLTLAQWAVESAYGTRTPAGSNNPFGIKARPGEPRVISATSEDPSGSNKVTGTQPFQKFASIVEAFDAHGRLLGLGSPYRDMVTAFLRSPRQPVDVDALAYALTGVYAVAQNYGDVLVRLMRSSNLYQYDTLPTEKPVTNVSKMDVTPSVVATAQAATAPTDAAKTDVPGVTQSPVVDASTAVDSIVALLEGKLDPIADIAQAAVLSKVPIIGAMLEAIAPHAARDALNVAITQGAAMFKATGNPLFQSAGYIIPAAEQIFVATSGWISKLGLTGAIKGLIADAAAKAGIAIK